MAQQAPAVETLKIGPLGAEGVQYLSSQSVISARWAPFEDPEESELRPYTHGIRDYAVAVGRQPGATDVKDFTLIREEILRDDTHVVLEGLRLHTGFDYYVTVRATNFVGLSTVLHSALLTIDNTPPEPGIVFDHIGVLQHFHEGSATLTTSFMDFEDPESGIAFYEWGAGSAPGHFDIVPLTRLPGGPDAQSASQSGLTLHDGHVVYVSVRATNLVGLHTTATSAGAVVDSSPPAHGWVHDIAVGAVPGNEEDIDAQADGTTLRAHWGGFFDPHSGIASFEWNIGTAPGRADVHGTVHAGLTREVTVRNLTLVDGATYFFNVRVCNHAELCVTASSDGVLVDSSPPLPGIVSDGYGGDDQAYWHLTAEGAASWQLFTDPHSRIISYDWCLGTQPGQCDVRTRTTAHLRLHGYGDMSAKHGQHVYATVWATNAAGLECVASSNGATIDTTPPVTVTEPAFDLSDFGQVTVALQDAKPGWQAFRSAFRLVWKFADPESGLRDSTWSVSTMHDGGMAPVAHRMVSGDAHEVMVAGLDLLEGEAYELAVRSCNGAHQCTDEVDARVYVDYTPPTKGNVLEIGNTWSGADLKLVWKGFVDPQSDVIMYYVTALGREVRVPSPRNTNKYNWEIAELREESTRVYEATIRLPQALTANQKFPVMIRAVNSAGLYITSQHWLIADNGGSVSVDFENLHTPVCLTNNLCEGQGPSCREMCTCTMQDNFLAHSLSCSRTTDSVAPVDLELVDSFKFGGLAELHAKQPFTCSLGAVWRAKRGTVLWYEWAVGTTEPGIGVGLRVNDDFIWQNCGLHTQAVFTLPFGEHLKPNIVYRFFVRAWYSETRYVVFSSPGVKVMAAPPSLKLDLADDRPQQLVHDGLDPQLELEYQTSTSTLSAAWPLTRILQSSHLEHFDHVWWGAGTLPGATDTVPFKRLDEAEKHTEAGLALRPGTTYYSTILVFDDFGFSQQLVSDGVLVDTTPPVPGVVNHLGHGGALVEVDFQVETNLLTAQWHSFHDFESAVTGYEYAVGTQPLGTDVLPFAAVGLHTRIVRKDTTLKLKTAYYVTVRASNAVGLVSQPVSSDVLYVDQEPPAPFQCVPGANVLTDSSFEQPSPAAVPRPASGRYCLEGEWRPPQVHVISWGFNVSGAHVTVRDGDTVRWVWDQNHPIKHDVVSGVGREPDHLFRSPLQSQGTYEYTFTDDGEYDYFCSVPEHTTMVGRITVVAFGCDPLHVCGNDELADVAAPGMRWQQRACRPCAACPAGLAAVDAQGQPAKCANSPGARCKAATPPACAGAKPGCSSTEFLDATCQCAPVTATCPEGHYEAQAPSGEADRVCLPCTPCGRDGVAVLPCSARADTQCRYWTLFPPDSTVESMQLEVPRFSRLGQWTQAVGVGALLQYHDFNGAAGVQGRMLGQAFGKAQIQTNVTGLQPGAPYQLSFYATSYPLWTRAGQRGYVSIGSLNRTFVLDAGHRASEVWRTFTFEFRAGADTEVLAFDNLGDGLKNNMVIDNVQVRMCDYQVESDADDVLVDVGPLFQNSRSFLQASWHMRDFSGIREYQWAVGTVPGGQQLQRFTSVGQATFALADDLELEHLMHVYATVIGYDTAGNSRRIVSPGVLIDHTPPVPTAILDGAQPGVDVDYQPDMTIAATWEPFSDPESGVERCVWGIGREPGSTNIMTFQPVTTPGAAQSGPLAGRLRAGDTAYVTVRCFNRAGLVSHAVSDGVAIVREVADARTARVDIVTSVKMEGNLLPALFFDNPLRGTHQAREDAMFLTWAGFTDPFGIAEYQYALAELAPCRACNGSFEYTSEACKGQFDTKCAPHTRCLPSEYEAQPGTADFDRVCKPCSTCARGFFAAAPCSASADTVCKRWRQCPTGYYEARPPTHVEDRRCLPCSECTTTEVLDAVCATRSNTRCHQRTPPCDPSTQYEAAPPTATTDRVCQPCPACGVNETRVQPCSNFAPGKCQAITVDLTPVSTTPPPPVRKRDRKTKKEI